MARVTGTDHPDRAVAFYDLTEFASAFHRCPDFHSLSPHKLLKLPSLNETHENANKVPFPLLLSGFAGSEKTVRGAEPATFSPVTPPRAVECAIWKRSSIILFNKISPVPENTRRDRPRRKLFSRFFRPPPSPRPPVPSGQRRLEISAHLFPSPALTKRDSACTLWNVSGGNGPAVSSLVWIVPTSGHQTKEGNFAMHDVPGSPPNSGNNHGRIFRRCRRP